VAIAVRDGVYLTSRELFETLICNAQCLDEDRNLAVVLVWAGWGVLMTR
jgi:hypothetical protein